MSEADLLPIVSHAPPSPPPPCPPVHLPSSDPSSKDTEQRGQSKGLISNSPALCLSAIEQGRKAVKNLTLQGLWSTQKHREDVILSCYNPVRPILQNGPVCGLVALSMASQLLKESHTSADDIFSEAQKRGFSKQGEMFSVLHMKELSSHFLNCSVEHLVLRNDGHVEQSELLQIIKHLLQRNVLLVPYDADKNHSPCQKRGHKAHWALLTGIVMAFQNLDYFSSSARNACTVDTEIPTLYYWPESPPLNLCEDLATTASALAFQREGSSPFSCIRFYVYGHQGKSKHAGIWSLSDLLQSNAQLEEAGPERNIEDYIIPPEGVSVGLKAQMLIFKRGRDY